MTAFIIDWMDGFLCHATLSCLLSCSCVSIIYLARVKVKFWQLCMSEIVSNVDICLIAA